MFDLPINQNMESNNFTNKFKHKDEISEFSQLISENEFNDKQWGNLNNTSENHDVRSQLSAQQKEQYKNEYYSASKQNQEAINWVSQISQNAPGDYKGPY